MYSVRPESNPHRKVLRFARIMGTRVAIAWLTLCACGIGHAQDSNDLARWSIALAGGYGDANGHVQVRENQIEGTRLDFGSGLGVHRLSDMDLSVRYRFDTDQSVQLDLRNYNLTGSTLLSRNVYFNGATFAAGTQLHTVTSFPNFLRATLFYQRTLSHFGNGGTLSGRAGFTFDALNFKLNGTLTPDSAGHETKEDFVTQELPVPVFGVALDEPLNQRLHFVASLDGAYLPRVNSLRKEGGEVTLAQTNLDATLELDYAITHDLHIIGGYRFGYLRQDERSHEDGNRIMLKSNAAELGLAYAF